MSWEESRDEQGHLWVSLPFVIRAFAVNDQGQTVYRLEGPGVVEDSRSTDVEWLKIEAELVRERTEFRKSLGV
jgi:hypothetical protein